MGTIFALSDSAANIGLIGVFFVVFPLLAHGLIALAVGVAIGERAENQEYFERGGHQGSTTSRNRSQG